MACFEGGGSGGLLILEIWGGEEGGMYTFGTCNLPVSEEGEDNDDEEEEEEEVDNRLGSDRKRC